MTLGERTGTRRDSLVGNFAVCAAVRCVRMLNDRWFAPRFAVSVELVFWCLGDSGFGCCQALYAFIRLVRFVVLIVVVNLSPIVQGIWRVS